MCVCVCMCVHVCVCVCMHACVFYLFNYLFGGTSFFSVFLSLSLFFFFLRNFKEVSKY